MAPSRIYRTSFNFDNQTGFYRGKVRDVYEINNQYLVMISTDRISAFDQVFMETIDYKGHILNEISNYFFVELGEIASNWLIECPHPNVTIGYKKPTLPYEFIVREYLDGWMYHEYQRGVRRFSGTILPDGLVRCSQLPEIVFGVTTKSLSGKDIPISYRQVYRDGLITRTKLTSIKDLCCEMFKKASSIYNQKGLILADTKFELAEDFTVIDEIFTPDCSRLYSKEAYHKSMSRGDEVKRFSKEVFRQMILDSGFDPIRLIDLDNPLPTITLQQRAMISQQYAQVYKMLLNKSVEDGYNQLEFINPLPQMYQAITDSLSRL